MEVLPEGVVLDVVPADPDAEAQPAAGEQIDVGRLPGHERRLALREDQDPGGEPDPLGDGGQVGEHHERVVERVVLGVRAGERRRSIGVHGTASSEPSSLRGKSALFSSVCCIGRCGRRYTSAGAICASYV